MPRPEPRHLIVCLLTLTLGLTAGCRGGEDDAETPPAPPPLQTVEVESPPVIDPSNDPKARQRRSTSLSGQLPGDFPEDLPLALPAAIEGIEGAGTTRATVSFFAPRPLAPVRTDLLGALEARGWRVVSDGDGRWQATKDGRDVALTVAATDGGTDYAYTY